MIEISRRASAEIVRLRCWQFYEILRFGAGSLSFLLSGGTDYPIQVKEPPRTALGLSNPKMSGWAARCSPTHP